MTGCFRWGPRNSAVDQFVVMGQISERNLFGRGQRLNLDDRLGSKTQRYNLSSLWNPGFLTVLFQPEFPFLTGSENMMNSPKTASAAAWIWDITSGENIPAAILPTPMTTPR